MEKWKYLVDLNEYMLRWFLDTLSIQTEFLKASDFAFKGKKSELVLDMCKQLGADVYIFGALGRDYTQVEQFEAAGIHIVFQDYQHPTYPQLHGGFISHLSIVDLLFTCGPKALNILMHGQDRLEL
jgi:hypothetical protein